MKCDTFRHVSAALMCLAFLLMLEHTPIAKGQDAGDEASLIAVIKSDASWLDKQTACRALRIKGTEASVPALAALLNDEKLSHLARFALEAMPYPEAGKALRDALGTAKGLPKAGIVSSLGVRRDAEAVPSLIPLLKDPSTDIANEAAGALGRIATQEAIAALLEARGKASKALLPAIAEGLLAAGQNLIRDGKADAAVPIYSELLKSRWPMYARSGAFHGLASAEPDKAPVRMIDALGGKEALFRNIAAQVIAETSGAETTKLYADALPKLSLEGKLALLRGLAARKDTAARPAVVEAMAASQKEVKLAAVKALAVLAGAQDVPALSALLVSDDAELAKAAEASLIALQGSDISPAIAESVPGVAPGSRAKLLEILLTRRAEQALPLAMNGLADSDVAVRTAGLRVLVSEGGKDQVQAVLQVLAKVSDAQERSAAEKALGSMCSRAGEETLPMLLEAMNGASTDTRIALLHTISRVGGPKALETVLAAIGDADAQISGEAVRLLTDWQTLDALPHILKLAQGDDLTRQVLALRGYVRLSGIEPSVEERARMLATAMTLVKRPDEKKLVIGAYGSLRTQQSLDALRPCFDDAAVQNEAALAMLAVAGELSKNAANKPQAVEALKLIAEKAADTAVRDQAQKALAALQ